MKVGGGCAEPHRWHDFVGLHPVHAFVQNRAGGAAAVIAHAIEVHHFSQSRRLLARSCEIIRQADGIQIGVDVVVGKVSEDLAAVWRFPPEQLKRQLVGVIPSHLLGDKVIHTGLLIDLR